MLEGPYKSKRSYRISEYCNKLETIYLVIAFFVGCYFVGSLGLDYFFVGDFKKRVMPAIFAALIVGTVIFGRRFWRLIGMTIFVTLAVLVHRVVGQ